MVVKSAPEFSKILRFCPAAKRAIRSMTIAFIKLFGRTATLVSVLMIRWFYAERTSQGPFFRQPSDRRFLRQQTQVAPGKLLYQAYSDTAREKRPALAPSSHHHGSVFDPPRFVQNGRGDIVTFGIGPL